MGWGASFHFAQLHVALPKPFMFFWHHYMVACPATRMHVVLRQCSQLQTAVYICADEAACDAGV